MGGMPPERTSPAAPVPLLRDGNASGERIPGAHDAAVSRRITLTAPVRLAGVTALLIGSAYFLAWMAGAAARWGASTVTMKTNAAVACTLAGAALLLSTRKAARASDVARILASALVLVIGLLTLSEHVLHVDLGIDQLLAREPPGALATMSPNRMGPPASVSM